MANAFKLLHAWVLCCATMSHTLLQDESDLGVHAQGPAKADLEAVEL